MTNFFINVSPHNYVLLANSAPDIKGVVSGESEPVADERKECIKKSMEKPKISIIFMAG